MDKKVLGFINCLGLINRNGDFLMVIDVPRA